MKITTFFLIALLCSAMNLTSCHGSNPAGAPASVEDAEAQLAKKRKKEAKGRAKAAKKAKKEFWKRQSKAARKSIKRNARRQKKIEKRNNQKGNYDYQQQEHWTN